MSDGTAGDGRACEGPASDGPADKGARTWSLRSGGLEVSSSRHPSGAVVVAVTGRVEGTGVAALSRCLHECLDAHPAVLVVDVSAVGVLDSSGLWTLYQALGRGARENVSVRLVGATPPVLRAIDVAAMTESFRIYSTIDAAANLADAPRMPPDSGPRRAG